MRHAIALTASLALLAPAGAEASEQSRFATKGTTLIQGTLELSSNESKSETKVEGMPDPEDTENTHTEFEVGPLLTHFVTNGFAIAFGGVFYHSASESDDEKEDFTIYGLTFGPYYYAELNPDLFAAIGLRATAAKGSGEVKADGETTETTVDVFAVQAEVGLAFPFGNGGVLEFLVFMRRNERSTEYEFTEGDVDIDTITTSVGLGMTVGLVF